MKSSFLCLCFLWLKLQRKIPEILTLLLCLEIARQLENPSRLALGVDLKPIFYFWICSGKKRNAKPPSTERKIKRVVNILLTLVVYRNFLFLGSMEGNLKLSLAVSLFIISNLVVCGEPMPNVSLAGRKASCPVLENLIAISYQVLLWGNLALKNQIICRQCECL